MSKKKQKFKDVWTNQTRLGKKFGLSAIAVGNILTQYGLKDAETKQATVRALNQGFAKSTPLRDGTPFFMWNIEKCKEILSKDHQELTPIDYWTQEVRKVLLQADKLFDQGQDKLACLLQDSAFDDVPKNIKADVKKKILGDTN